MENKYDNEFVRKQLYDLYGKSKGVSYHEFTDELNQMVKNLYQDSIKHDNFKKEYYKKHKLCPKCQAMEHSTTLMSYTLNLKNPQEYKDLNSCVCTKCKHIHTTHDRISI
jgi:hypothetical protein